jgi:hypothetical protein
MQTLTPYNLDKPEDGDRGSVFWDALAEAIQRLHDHAHDGDDSAPVSSANLTATTQDITSWTEVSTDMWRATVTLPTGITFSDFSMEFVITASDDANDEGQRIHPTITKITESSMYVYVHKDGMTVKAIYR